MDTVGVINNDRENYMYNLPKALPEVFSHQYGKWSCIRQYTAACSYVFALEVFIAS